MEKDFVFQRKIRKVNLIGQVLLKKNLINPEQLEAALNIQRVEGGLLGNILVSKGFISEESFTIALSSQLDLAYIPIEKYNVSKEAIKMISRDLADKYCLFPLEKIGSVLILSCVDPLNVRAITEVETAANCQVVPIIGMRSEIEKAINTYMAYRNDKP